MTCRNLLAALVLTLSCSAFAAVPLDPANPPEPTCEGALKTIVQIQLEQARPIEAAKEAVAKGDQPTFEVLSLEYQVLDQYIKRVQSWEALHACRA